MLQRQRGKPALLIQFRDVSTVDQLQDIVDKHGADLDVRQRAAAVYCLAQLTSNADTIQLQTTHLQLLSRLAALYPPSARAQYAASWDAWRNLLAAHPSLLADWLLKHVKHHGGLASVSAAAMKGLAHLAALSPAAASQLKEQHFCWDDLLKPAAASNNSTSEHFANLLWALVKLAEADCLAEHWKLSAEQLSATVDQLQSAGDSHRSDALLALATLAKHDKCPSDLRAVTPLAADAARNVTSKTRSHVVSQVLHAICMLHKHGMPYVSTAEQGHQIRSQTSQQGTHKTQPAGQGVAALLEVLLEVPTAMGLDTRESDVDVLYQRLISACAHRAAARNRTRACWLSAAEAKQRVEFLAAICSLPSLDILHMLARCPDLLQDKGLPFAAANAELLSGQGLPVRTLIVKNPELLTVSNADVEGVLHYLMQLQPTAQELCSILERKTAILTTPLSKLQTNVAFLVALGIEPQDIKRMLVASPGFITKSLKSLTVLWHFFRSEIKVSCEFSQQGIPCS